MHGSRKRPLVALIVLAFVCLLSLPGVMSGQESIPVAGGDDIRLRLASGSQVRGTLLEWGRDTLRLQDSESGFERAFPVVGIERVQASRPRSTGAGVLRGLLWGSILGSVALGTVIARDPKAYEGDRGKDFLIGAAIGVVAGGSIGALIGGSHPGRKWVDARSGS